MRRANVQTHGALLEVTDLRTSFKTPRGRVRAVDGVSFTLDRGRSLGIVGESGSGKTVLARSIMGLLTGRNVRPGGLGAVRGPGADRPLAQGDAPHLGPGDVDDLPGPDDVAEPADEDRQADHRAAQGAPRHEGSRTPRRRPSSCCATCRSPRPTAASDQYPHELSGGMRQRVMIAIALACGPTLLFADEPTTALDVTVQSQILAVIGRARRERNMSMILVTHDLGVVAGHTDEIAVMYGGRIVEKASTTTLFADMKMPYTEALMASIPKLDDPPHSVLRTIPGRPPDLVNPPRGLSLRAALPVRQGALHRGGAAADRHRRPRAHVRVLVPGRLARASRAPGRARRCAHRRLPPSRTCPDGRHRQGPPPRPATTCCCASRTSR